MDLALLIYLSEGLAFLIIAMTIITPFKVIWKDIESSNFNSDV
jgi:hypothetical protein